MKTMKSTGLWRLLAVAVMMAVAVVRLAAQVPERPASAQFVVDKAGIIKDSKTIDDTLRLFSRRTGIQIEVVTLPSLGGMEIAEMAQQIGQKWGVGKNDKGVVILVKPKTSNSSEGRGGVFIATGYGLEGDLTDAYCSRIINELVLAEFKKGDYTAGVWAAVDVIIPVTDGALTFDDAMDAAKRNVKSHATVRTDAPAATEAQDSDESDMWVMLMVYGSAGLFLWLWVAFGYVWRRKGGYSGTDDDDDYSSSGSSGDDDYGGGSFGGGGAGASW